jgi:hypothetical protein
MLRNLMMILGLSLAVTAFGCAEESNGGGGSGGMGGTPAVTDACLNAADTAAVCDEGFSGVVSTCATAASGVGAATSTCLQQAPPDGAGLSADCADCQGDQVECIRDNCTLSGENTPCLPPDFGGMFGPGTPECETCADDAGCTAAYDTCAGAVDCGGAGGGGGAGGAS